MIRIILFLFILIFFGCKPNITKPTSSVGSINSANYVAIGNSFTSGYADGALYYEGQLYSYPNLIAQQFALASGQTIIFKQPLVSSSSIGVGLDKNSKLQLGYVTDCLGVTSLMPFNVASKGDTSIFVNNIFSLQGPFNNMGVPGIRVIDVVTPGYGNITTGNPFFARMASNPATTSVLLDAINQNPTFFSLFIGTNDALLYAMNGAASGNLTPSAGVAGVGFDASLDSLVNALMRKTDKGAIANIPDITTMPFFTTIPYNGLTLRQGQADTLNASPASAFFHFNAGANGFIIEDINDPKGFRQAQKGDLILLSVPLNKIKCNGMGSLTPVPDKYVLTISEIQAIQYAINSYNSKIYAVAQNKHLAFVDINAAMSNAIKGIVYNGININTQFVTGGMFSLDGIHFNPMGNAFLANTFIKAINQTYNASIPLLDVTKYRGCIFP